MERNPADVRAEFAAAAAAAVEVVAAVPGGTWDTPGLGEWTVRDLVGHLSRSFVTVEQYLATPPPPGAPVVADPRAYYAAVRAQTAADGAGSTQRGRDAGAALGGDPSGALRALADRVLALVAGTPDDAVVAAFGRAEMRLVDYLVTRTFELTVHTLDLARAVGVEPPAGLDRPVAGCLLLAAELAADTPVAAELLLVLTGRTGLGSVSVL